MRKEYQVISGMIDGYFMKVIHGTYAFMLELNVENKNFQIPTIVISKFMVLFQKLLNP